MYQELWDKLPGAWWAKLTVLLVTAALIVVLLLEVVFPWVGPRLPGSEVEVGSTGSSVVESHPPSTAGE